jgi:hypothetical protein
MTSEGVAELTPVDHAFAAIATHFEHLVKLLDDGGLDDFDHSRMVRFMQDSEQLRNRWSLIDHQVFVAAERLDLPTVLCQGSMRRVLTSVLSVSKGEAARRVRAAEAVGPRTSMLGEHLEPVRPVLAAAQQAGEVSAEKVAIIERALDKVDRRGFDPADIATGEALLVEHAALFPPEDLKLLADRFVDVIDPDGSVPDDQLNTDRRYFHLRPTRHGPMSGTSGSPAPPGPNSRRCWIRWRNPASIRPEKSIRGPMGNARTTPSRICATGCCGPATSPTPAVFRPRSSSPSTSTT